MTKKILLAAIAAACAVALTAGPAQASGRSTLAVSLTPDPAVPFSCPDDALFGFGLGVATVRGRPLGTAQSCIASIAGCDPLVAFCRQTVRATFTLDLPHGSLTVPLKLLEIWPSPSSFLQAGSGAVSAGTGVYARAKGRLAGGGAGSFDDEGNFTGRLIYVAELRGVAR